MEKFLLSFYEGRDEYDDAQIILPFLYESADLARTFLDEKIQEYCRDWENYYGTKGRTFQSRGKTGAKYPVEAVNFCGHSIRLWHLNGGSKDFSSANSGYEIQKLEDWWKENCKN